jgi:hypothetical protein
LRGAKYCGRTKQTRRIESLLDLGYDSVDKIKAEEKPGRLHQKMMEYRKKNKLEIGTVTVEEVAPWLGK